MWFLSYPLHHSLNIFQYTSTNETVALSGDNFQFGPYHFTRVGSNDTIMYTLVIAEPYRNTIIIQPFFPQISNLSQTSYLFSCDLISTAKIYSDLNTELVEIRKWTFPVMLRSIPFQIQISYDQTIMSHTNNFFGC